MVSDVAPCCTVAVVFRRIGPYHQARLEALAGQTRTVAIELSPLDATYDWAPVQSEGRYQRVPLYAGSDSGNAPRSLGASLRDSLDELVPTAVAVPGWSNPGALAAISWCVQRRVPVIVMSESARHDACRVWWKERAKRKVVGLCSAGLVGGQLHAMYLSDLGMPQERIFTGYDVVDNGYYMREAEAARAATPFWRSRLALPEQYFLACSRFVQKKNITTLLSAYASYRQQAGGMAWKLVLVGDGVLRPQILGVLEDLGLEGEVVLPGFIQYDVLPVYYGLASVFVHASATEQWGLVVNEAMAAGLPVLVSDRCGCVPELVRNGGNGFTFDPFDLEHMAGLMLTMSSENTDLDAMGRLSRQMISHWGPARFASAMMDAVECALAAPTPQAKAVDRAFLGLLARSALGDV